MPSQRLLVLVCGLFGPLLFVTASIVGGLLIPGYDPIAQFISESYAMDTQHGVALRFFGFLPSGLLIAVFAWCATRCVPPSRQARIGFAGIGIFYGLGTVTTVFFPCDAGCNKELIDPSAAQLIHNLSGLLTYLTVPVALLLLGMAARTWPHGARISRMALVLGALALVSAWMFLADPGSPVAGAIQRIAEGCILLWIVACAWHIGRTRTSI